MKGWIGRGACYGGSLAGAGHGVSLAAISLHQVGLNNMIAAR